jgi:DNA-directed DNA polymerase III PolC
MLLNCHSWFSLTYGVMSPEQLLQEAQAQGITAMALTDINCTAGLSDFFRLAATYKVRPIAGIEFRAGARLLYIGIARSNEGLYHLHELLTRHLLHGEPLPERAPEMPDTYIVYPYTSNPPTDLRPDEYIGVRHADLNRMRFTPLARRTEKLLALASVTMRTKQDHNVHRLLRAIDTNTLLGQTPTEHVAPATECFVTEEELCAQFAVAPELVQNTRRLMDQCEVHFGFGQPKNLRCWSGNPEEDRRLLLEETQRGLLHRYGANNAVATARLEKELAVVQQKDFVSYFLINWDLIRFAKHKGFFHVGRGSGANSIAAYCLGITDVDPIELDLYFERFINPSRSSPPDFDLDFSWKDRDQVQQYLFDTYGKDNRVALLGTYNTFQSRAVVRELGKVFGLPPAEIDALADPRLTTRLSKLDKVAQTIVKYSPLLIDMPRHISIHVGGVLISEKPLTYYTALHRPPKDMPTVQFSMLEAEDIGLHKFDILSQRGLGHIRDAVDLVHQKRGERIDIHDIPRFKEDEGVRQLIEKGDTIGAFYVESPAMRMLLKKLKVRTYLELVAASSIIRPGVSSSGMMKEYILRHHDPKRREQAHPILMDIMPETYGVMVYQEDVIKVAHLYAGLTLAEADILRRGMSGKFRSRAEFQRVKERWFINCKKKGYTDADAAEIWRQTESFAGYSFAKGHSASYAVESYQSLYLKAHYPIEFMVAVANNFGGFYHTEFYLNEARHAGASIHPPCVNLSDEWCTLHGKDIYLGLQMVRSLNEETVGHILTSRQRHGPYTSFLELLERVPIHQEVRLLIRSGALRFTGKSKQELYWQLLMYQRGQKHIHDADLFRPPVKTFDLPKLETFANVDAWDEYEVIGYPLSDPYQLPHILPGETILARDMRMHIGRRVRMLGYVVHVKPSTTKTGERMEFGCYMDKEGRLWDGVHFPEVAMRYPILGRGIYLLTGKIEEEFGHHALTVEKAEKVGYRADPRYAA